jgi:hypothetical protein
MKILLAIVDTSKLILELVRIKHFQGDTTTMNLKLVVASMSVLGLVSCPVFAATTTKHKHHYKHQQTVAHHDYKDMGALPYKDQPVCTISQDTVIMSDMTQNMGRSLPNPCNPGWFNRIAVSGGINVDLGKFGNRNGFFMGENFQRFSLNDAYLNVAADVNEWAKAFASLSYNTATVNAPATAVGVIPPGVAAPGSVKTEYSAAYSNNVDSGSSSTIQLEQAFATIANFNESPFFAQIGKHFQDFSRYEIHPITRSMTQVMSETLATSLDVGFLTSGFHGEVYAFDDPISKVFQSSSTTNYGATLGYDQPSECLGFDVGIGYLYNLIGVNDVAYMVNQINSAVTTGTPGYHTRIGGGAVYGDINSGPFTLGARYTSALTRFSILDLPKNGVTPSARGGKPWAAGVQAGYGFDAWGKNNNVYVGYQASNEAVGLGLPKSRWLAGFGLDVFGKNTNVGLEWDHDSAYNVSNGGTGNNYNLVSVRTSVKFG